WRGSGDGDVWRFDAPECASPGSVPPGSVDVIAPGAVPSGRSKLGGGISPTQRLSTFSGSTRNLEIMAAAQLWRPMRTPWPVAGNSKTWLLGSVVAAMCANTGGVIGSYSPARMSVGTALVTGSCERSSRGPDTHEPQNSRF